MDRKIIMALISLLAIGYALFIGVDWAMRQGGELLTLKGIALALEGFILWKIWGYIYNMRRFRQLNGQTAKAGASTTASQRETAIHPALTAIPALLLGARAFSWEELAFIYAFFGLLVWAMHFIVQVAAS
jgi:hypothetical protein